MALLKAGDAAAATRLVGADEATLLIGNGPADWYPGGQANPNSGSDQPSEADASTKA